MANENSLELKVSLKVNESLPDVRTQLDQLESKLRTLKLNATLDIGKSTPIINQKIDKLTNSVKKINLVAGLDFAKSKDNINKTIKKLDNNVKIKGNVELDSNKIIKAKKEVTSLNKLLKSSGKYELGIKGNNIREVKKNEWLFLDSILHEVSDFIIPFSHSYEYVAEVLDCEFENHEDRQVIEIAFITNLYAKTKEEAELEIAYKLQAHFLDFKQIEIKETYGEKTYEFEVIHDNLTFDIDTLEQNAKTKEEAELGIHI